MEPENINQLKKLAKVFNTDNVITSAEIEQVLTGIMSIMASFRKENVKLTEENRELVSDLMGKVETEYKKLSTDISSKEKGLSDTFIKEISKVKDKFQNELNKAKDLIKELKSIEIKDGKDADEEQIVKDVLAQIKLPENKETVLDNGEQIVNKINELPVTEDVFKIDFIHIKNVPEFSLHGRPNGGGWRTGGSGTVTSVSVTPANGFSGVVATATTTPAITIDVSGLDATKIADGSVTDTEFQYINTLTSNAQTQLNAKATNPMTSKNDIIIGDTGGVPIRLAENNTADPYALISQGAGVSNPISWVQTIGTNAVNGINNAANTITASNPVIETTGLTGILSTYAKRIYADYSGSANVAGADTYIMLSGVSITATLQTPTAGQIHYFFNNSGSKNFIDASGGSTIGNQGTLATTIEIQNGEVLGVVGDGGNWLYLNTRSHSDTYVPTLTGVTNVGTATLLSASFERVGNKVNVDMMIEVTATTLLTSTVVGISIPYAMNFINAYDLYGTAYTTDGTSTSFGGGLYADTTNDRAELAFYDLNGAIKTFSIHFSYMTTS